MSYIIRLFLAVIICCVTGFPVNSNNIVPVIFIPGIMGSPLYDDLDNNNRLIPGEKAWVGNLYSNLLLKNNGIDPLLDFNIKVAPLRNDPGNNLVNELVKVPMDIYKGFFINLEQNGYKTDNYDSNHDEQENLFCFTYDWRKNNSVNAYLLSSFIDSVIMWTGSDKVNLICHSMGGIVAKKCISLYDKSRIEKVIFIATPHLGAPEMLTVFLTGKLFTWLKSVFTQAFVRTLARNLPACYQLIPSAAYFDTTISNNFSAHTWIHANSFRIPDGSYTDYYQMNSYLKSFKSSLNENLNSPLIDSSHFFRESISDISFGDIQIYNIVGYNFPTIGRNSIIITPPFNYITIKEEYLVNGDSTVPLKSAEIINNTVVENTYYIPDIIHSALPASQEVLQVLTGVLQNPPVTHFPQYKQPPASYLSSLSNTDNKDNLLNAFQLFQNYPNPFNPETNISYSIPAQGPVKLRILDILGREVEVLVNEIQPAGRYNIIFNASHLSSGIYFCEMHSGDFRISKKMTLLK